MLRDGRSDDELKINYINLSSGLPGGDRCNFKCCYCSYGEELGKCDRKDNVYEIIQQIGELLDISFLSYNSGDITVSPYRDEILRIWKAKRWRGEISTNAAIYTEGIYDLLNHRLIELNVSLDAGTANTFTKIKGVDCFEKVVKNLEQYAMAGKNILLKYIILEGINDNDADIDGFVEIAARINAKRVIISRNTARIFIKMTENEYSAVLRLARQSAARNLSYTLLKDFLITDSDRLKTDGLWS
jgi:molybdenum cofactor biosynthesis enzyme MoaA